jgi:hypothetical protein
MLLPWINIDYLLLFMEYRSRGGVKLLFLLILSVILGAVAANLTGIGFLFWVVAIFVFICGLPGALITGFIHGENKYAQDRADYRETMREIAEDERAYEHEMYEDVRMDRYLDKLDELHDLDDFAAPFFLFMCFPSVPALCTSAYKSQSRLQTAYGKRTPSRCDS